MNDDKTIASATILDNSAKPPTLTQVRSVLQAHIKEVRALLNEIKVTASKKRNTENEVEVNMEIVKLFRSLASSGNRTIAVKAISEYCAKCSISKSVTEAYLRNLAISYPNLFKIVKVDSYETVGVVNNTLYFKTTLNTAGTRLSCVKIYKFE